MGLTSVAVTNQSGQDFQSTLFAERPQVDGVSGQVYACIISTEHVRSDDTGSFTIGDRFFAVIGTSEGRLSEGVSITATQAMPAQLGSSSFTLTSQYGAPQFLPSRPSGGLPGDAFVISTEPNFTRDDAQQGNWIVGVGGMNTDGRSAASAVFLPGPNERYQIRPSNKYYVTFGRDLRPGSIIDKDRLSQPSLSFEATGNITLVHGDDGMLRLRLLQSCHTPQYPQASALLFVADIPFYGPNVSRFPNFPVLTDPTRSIELQQAPTYNDIKV